MRIRNKQLIQLKFKATIKEWFDGLDWRDNMQNNKEFANGCNYIIEEVQDYIKTHKETIRENFPFQDGGECWCDREVLDVEEFLEWLNNI